MTDFFIAALKSDTDITWIEYNDLDKEGTYAWTDGTPMDYTKSVSNEPTGSTAENCGLAFHIATGYGFYDSPCNAQANSFCKCSPLDI